MKNQKIILLLFVFYSGCTATKESKKNCLSARQGNFIINSYNNSGIGHWRKLSYLVNRTDTSETIIFVPNMFPPDTTYYGVRWLKPCTYETTYISGTNKDVDSLIENGVLSKKRKLQINKITRTYYIERFGDEIDTVWIRLSDEPQ